MSNPEIQTYRHIPDFLDRPAEDLLNNELKFHPRKQKAIAKAAPRIIGEIRSPQSDIEMMRDLEGPFVFAPNHEDFLDIVINGTHAYDIGHGGLSFMAKSELMNDSNKTIAWFLHHHRAIPIDRSNAGAWIDKVNEIMVHILVEEGLSVVVYPSGSRNKSIEDSKKGALHIAAQAGVEIVPVGIGGSKGALKRLQKGKRSTFGLSYAEPRAVEDPDSALELHSLVQNIKRQMYHAERLIR